MWKWDAEGQPKAVVAIIHGAYEHHNKYAWLIQKLRSSGFHVVAGDLPGHGVQTGRKVHDEAFDSYINFTRKLLEVALSDNLPLFVIGHGLGATITMRLIQTEEIECAGFIFSSPWLSLIHHPPKSSSVLTKITSSMKMNHDISITMMSRNIELYTEERQDWYFSSSITAAWYKEMLALMKSVTQHEQAIRDVPILLHSAERDAITDIATTKKWLIDQGLSEFQYKEWKHLYHDVFQEPEREEVYLYTESFMNDVLRSVGYVV